MSHTSAISSTDLCNRQWAYIPRLIETLGYVFCNQCKKLSVNLVIKRGALNAT